MMITKNGQKIAKIWPKWLEEGKRCPEYDENSNHF